MIPSIFLKITEMVNIMVVSVMIFSYQLLKTLHQTTQVLDHWPSMVEMVMIKSRELTKQ